MSCCVTSGKGQKPRVRLGANASRVALLWPPGKRFRSPLGLSFFMRKMWSRPASIFCTTMLKTEMGNVSPF